MGMFKLTGLHILLTYRCILECEHCFVWGSPRQSGVLTIEQIDQILDQAKAAEVDWIYFEGGEPFLYYAELVHGVQHASELGFSVGVVTNAYWAVSVADAVAWLHPFAGQLADLTVSSDLYHCDKCLGEEPQNAIAAAKWLNIPTGMISIAQTENQQGSTESSDEGAVMFRGRAADALAATNAHQRWESLTSCPHEDLANPGRVHVDPFGNLHVCQGISIGNLFSRPLREICETYDPHAHAICGLLLDGGPAAIVTEFSLPHRDSYADACHLCYEARAALRPRFSDLLRPDQMYSVKP